MANNYKIGSSSTINMAGRENDRKRIRMALARLKLKQNRPDNYYLSGLFNLWDAYNYCFTNCNRVFVFVPVTFMI